MKPPIAAFCLIGLGMLPLAYAQDGPRGTPGGSTAPFQGQPAPGAPGAPGGAPGTAVPRVFPADSVLPEPAKLDDVKPASIVLPQDPIEPYLLTKDNGPFMVMAKTFRGPDAERYALALALELRRDYHLPAYILRIKDFPHRSMIRNVPPTAPEYIRKAQLTEPEKVRSYDEAVVLVGDEKTLQGSEKLWQQVRKIKPKCLDNMPRILFWREGLSKALRTTNPYVPAQNLFPGRSQKDKLITQMNGGPHSVLNCPGRYTLQVAEFSGRAIDNPSSTDSRLFDNNWLRQSPLVTAADDAERIADALAKDEDIQRTGFQPYVYHDRTSSKVMIGSFDNPNDAAAVRLRDTLLRIAIPLATRMHSKRQDDLVIAPAAQLTDLEDPNSPIKLK
jgi:hypothetical protein